MIDRTHALAVKRQAQVLGISRTGVYYLPRPVAVADLALMRGSTSCTWSTRSQAAACCATCSRLEASYVGRKHVATLMRRMGIEALYRRPNTSKRHPQHMVYPYLLRGLAIERANQVWAMDLTYIPMARGFVYLAAVMDWHSRKVLAWDVSNTDQGSQFTGLAFTDRLKREGVAISMDGRGCWMDNVFIERLSSNTRRCTCEPMTP
jgi:putative transposase